jgi:putative flippase GtrA
MQTTLSRRWQIVRFCTGGAAGVIAYYAALYGLTEYLGVWYIASAIVAFFLWTGINFIVQKFWTFQNTETHMVRRQIVLYVSMTSSFFVGNTLCLYLMVQHLHMWYIGAQMILTIIISIVSFILTSRIFKDEQPPPVDH